MKWYINLIALCAALATASPTPGKTINFPNNHVAAERGICIDKPGQNTDCCCTCAWADAYPCIGCTGFIYCPFGDHDISVKAFTSDGEHAHY